MKRKATAAALILCLLLLTSCTGKIQSPAEEKQTVIAGVDIEESLEKESSRSENNRLSDIDLSEGMPESSLPVLTHASNEYNAATALCFLGLCSGHTEERSAQLLENAGFTVLLQANFDKDAGAPDHTCAYSVGVRALPDGREQYIVTVRGTNGGEWYSNFDFAPSQAEDTAFAENFLFAAENIYAALTQIIDFTRLPQILVCGHSRGAACSNLLGVLLDESYIPENIYTYTYATPLTVRPAYFENNYDNIFNIINPGDVVPRLPLAGWGYAHAGIDIVLQGDSGAVSRAEEVENTLFCIAPDISSYYTVRHSLTCSGESENGVTAFEMMELLSSAFSGAADLTADNRTDSPDFDVDTDLSEIIADESDFAPLRDLLGRAMEDGGSAAADVLTEHLPVTYAKLLG